MMLSIFSFDAEAQRLKRRGAVVFRPKARCLNTVWVEGHWVWNKRIQRHIWVEGHWAVRKAPYASRIVRRSNRWYY